MVREKIGDYVIVIALLSILKALACRPARRERERMSRSLLLATLVAASYLGVCIGKLVSSVRASGGARMSSRSAATPPLQKTNGTEERSPF